MTFYFPRCSCSSFYNLDGPAIRSPNRGDSPNRFAAKPDSRGLPLTCESQLLVPRNAIRKNKRGGPGLVTISMGSLRRFARIRRSDSRESGHLSLVGIWAPMQKLASIPFQPMCAPPRSRPRKTPPPPGIRVKQVRFGKLAFPQLNGALFGPRNCDFRPFRATFSMKNVWSVLFRKRSISTFGSVGYFLRFQHKNKVF